MTARVPLDRKPRRYQFSGGIDQIEVWGSLAVIYEICFLPGWTCAHFESQAFPQGSIGEAEYAGLTLVSDGTMTVDGDFLKVEAPTQTQPGTMIEDPRSPHAHTNIRGSIRRRASTNTQPLRVNFRAPFPEDRGEPMTLLPILGLVEPVIIDIPAIGVVAAGSGAAPNARTRRLYSRNNADDSNYTC